MKKEDVADMMARAHAKGETMITVPLGVPRPDLFDLAKSIVRVSREYCEEHGLEMPTAKEGAMNRERSDMTWGSRQSYQPPRALTSREVQAVISKLQSAITGIRALNPIIWAAQLETEIEKLRLLAGEMERKDAAEVELQGLRSNIEHALTSLAKIRENIEEPHKGTIDFLEARNLYLEGREKELVGLLKEKDRQLEEGKVELKALRDELYIANRKVDKAQGRIDSLKLSIERSGSQAEQVAVAVADALRRENIGAD